MSNFENLIPPANSDCYPPQGSGPLPLDGKIREGMALYDALGEEDLRNLDEHVSSVFDSMRRDKSTEYSRCIAYAPGATQEYEAALDSFLVTVADRQNHGMQVVENESPNEKCGYLDVWKGQDPGHVFKISKFSGANIVMMDGTINEGTIYGLFSLTKRN